MPEETQDHEPFSMDKIIAIEARLKEAWEISINPDLTAAPWRHGKPPRFYEGTGSVTFHADQIYTDDGEKNICQVYDIWSNSSVEECEADARKNTKIRGGMANARFIAMARGVTPMMCESLVYLIESLRRDYGSKDSAVKRRAASRLYYIQIQWEPFMNLPNDREPDHSQQG